MEPFIRSDQYNFIRTQIQVLVNAHSSVNDKVVLHALKSLSNEKIFHLFSDLTEEQQQLLSPISTIKDKSEAEKILAQIKPFVFPFKKISDQAIKKLFPKAKKLKTPILENLDLTEITYLGWDDIGSNKKYIVTYYNQKLIGLQGTFHPVNKKGICTFCHKLEEIGMFMTKTKGTEQGTFTKRGNYICQDSGKCNLNLTSVNRLNDFIQLVNG